MCGLCYRAKVHIVINGPPSCSTSWTELYICDGELNFSVRTLNVKHERKIDSASHYLLASSHKALKKKTKQGAPRSVKWKVYYIVLNRFNAFQV